VPVKKTLPIFQASLDMSNKLVIIDIFQDINQKEDVNTEVIITLSSLYMQKSQEKLISYKIKMSF
jgi:hypothetical protein